MLSHLKETIRASLTGGPKFAPFLDVKRVNEVLYLIFNLKKHYSSKISCVIPELMQGIFENLEFMNTTF
jgi:hypothetical protein